MTATEPAFSEVPRLQADSLWTAQGAAIAALRQSIPGPIGDALTTQQRPDVWLLGRSMLSADRRSDDSPDSRPASASVLRADDARIAAVIWGHLHPGTEATLRALGFGNCCRTPAESVVSSYLLWRERFVARLDDDCSVVLWDERNNRLILVNQPGSPDASRTGTS